MCIAFGDTSLDPVEASISDPEIIALCGNIQRSQRAEVDQMERILERY